MVDYVMSVRAVENNAFTGDVGETQFLAIPSGQNPLPAHAIPADAWYAQVLKEASWQSGTEPRGDILFFVHGFNNSEGDVMNRHRSLQQGLGELSFKGVIVSFDWPCGNTPLAYISDRHKAIATANTLVSRGIYDLADKQTPNCPINVHVLCHSMGAFVLREAFDDADNTKLPTSGWGVSQIIFAAGDVSSDSMSESDRGAESIYRHSVRVTNYSNRYDEVLGISNVKRLGIAPRVGRVGLPSDCPTVAINVDCTNYYQELTADNSSILASDQPNGFGGVVQSHSWYFGNRMFTEDLFNVIIGTDRTIIKTRSLGQNGAVSLQHV